MADEMRLQRADVPPVYPLTARLPGRPFLQVIGELVEGGALWIQYREKELPDGARLEEIEQATGCLPALTRLIINDRVDLALAGRADGVHLGDSDLSPSTARRVGGELLILGFSTHDLQQATQAAADPSVDYVAIGPIFRSGTKNVREPIGLEPIRQLRAVTDKPIVAIGGIDKSTIRSVLGAGADSAAVIGCLYGTGSIRQNLLDLLDAAERGQ